MFKELFKERTRMLLTILAIAWGTFAIASMLAIGEGLRVTFSTAVANAGENLLTLSAGRTSKEYKGLRANSQVNLLKSDYVLIRALPSVQYSSSVYSFSGKMKFGEKTLSVPIQAVNQDYAIIHKISIQPGGRFISKIDNQNKSAVIVLGTKTLEDLFPSNPNPVGQTITISNKPFLIVGAMEEKSQIVASEAPDAFSNWMPVNTYELLGNPQIINSISIKYQKPDQLDSLKKTIQKTIALDHGVDPADDNIVNFSDVAKQQEKITSFFLGMEIFLGIVGALTLMVAGVGIANVMFASVKKSTHEIGVRMAIGARAYQILLHYIFESFTATTLGGLLGLLMSYGLVYGLRTIPMSGRLIEAIGKPKPVLSIFVVLMVIVVLGVTGLFAGLFPALQAAKVDPAEALRYE
ncbi:MAG: ABC transporter permease [Pseudomonadota bacterium]